MQEMRELSIYVTLGLYPLLTAACGERIIPAERINAIFNLGFRVISAFFEKAFSSSTKHSKCAVLSPQTVRVASSETASSEEILHFPR